MPGHLSSGGWRKATASAGNGACVELRGHDGRVQVRDSKHPDGPVLTYTQAEFAAFLDGAKAGEFDQLWTAGSDPQRSSP